MINLHKKQLIIIKISMIFLCLIVMPLSAEESSIAQQSNEVSVSSVLYTGEVEKNKTKLARSISPFNQLNNIRDLLPTITALLDPQKQIDAKALDLNIIGTSIDIPELSRKGSIKDYFLQYDLPNGGQLLGIRINSPEATGIRIGLLIDNIPNKVSVAFFSANEDRLISPIMGSEIAKVIAMNKAAGDNSKDGRTYWGGTVDGNEVIILFHLPKEVDTDKLRLTIPQIGYFFKKTSMIKAYRSTACSNRDVVCNSSIKKIASGVAKMRYRLGKYFYNSGKNCTGVLLNDQNKSNFIPYFLTAHHCISTQTIASTVETDWYYQSTICDGWSKDKRYIRHSGGAKLLYTASSTDTTLLRLNKQPPKGVSYLGWTTTNPRITSSIFGVHHLGGGKKKVNTGTVRGYFNCPEASGSYTCSSTSEKNGEFIKVIFYTGTGGEGASGSPLLNNKKQVIGVLTTGDKGACSTEGNWGAYGRFSLAYKNGLKKWLSKSGGSSTPSIPKNVKASDGTYSDKVKITWSRVSGATSYKIYRCTSNSTSSCNNGWKKSSSPYYNRNGKAGQKYYYRVKACCSGQVFPYI